MVFISARRNLIAITLGIGVMAASPVAALADDVARGKEIYDGVGACASCHGALGGGDGPAAAALTPKPKNFQKAEFSLDTNGDGKVGTAEDVYNVITNGAAKYNGSMFMVGRVDLSEADRKALAAYVLSLKQ